MSDIVSFPKKLTRNGKIKVPPEALETLDVDPDNKPLLTVTLERDSK